MVNQESWLNDIISSVPHLTLVKMLLKLLSWYGVDPKEIQEAVQKAVQSRMSNDENWAVTCRLSAKLTIEGLLRLMRLNVVEKLEEIHDPYGLLTVMAILAEEYKEERGLKTFTFLVLLYAMALYALDFWEERSILYIEPFLRDIRRMSKNAKTSDLGENEILVMVLITAIKWSLIISKYK